MAKALQRAIAGLDELGWRAKRSPEIAKGSLWFGQILEDLGHADAAIVCLTPENVNNPWMHFEAGAIVAKIRGRSGPRVFPYLFRMKGIDLEGPLAQFQTTHATRADTFRLLHSLMTDAQWKTWKEKTRQMWWDRLADDLREAEHRPLTEILPDIEPLFRRKTFDEPLDDCVNQSWFARLRGAQDTHQQVKAALDVYASQCRPYVGELLGQLREAADSYAMALELLLSPMHFDLVDDGKRRIPPGLLAACENRRRRVKHLISTLADPTQVPVVDSAPRFQALEDPVERESLVRQFERQLGNRTNRIGRTWRMPDKINADAAKSRWDLDRIAFYLSQNARRQRPSLEATVGWLRMEWTRVAADRVASHLPLIGCLELLERAMAGPHGKKNEKQDDGQARYLAEAATLLQEISALGKYAEGQTGPSKPSPLAIKADALVDRLERFGRQGSAPAAAVPLRAATVGARTEPGAGKQAQVDDRRH
ncbi:MAG: hypothetical protein H6945_08190 [Zoogloeaceae bacterium]|nr:hypothetical protein [Rhodocyclaceae bacterium]MCP5235701.1 hypothetical protein [Zoogloeaceae bacterium]